jgi:hypothetical protein
MPGDGMRPSAMIGNETSPMENDGKDWPRLEMITQGWK